MKKCSKCKISKEFIEFTKSNSEKSGISRWCKGCFSQYFQQHREEYKKRYSKWRIENIDKARESERKRFQLPSRKHKHRINQARRRASKLKATIAGFESDIKKIYDNCPEGYHVDHIVPLRGKNVCGLHVPWNLQYLTPKDNMKKGNRLILDEREY